MRYARGYCWPMPRPLIYQVIRNRSRCLPILLETGYEDPKLCWISVRAYDSFYRALVDYQSFGDISTSDIPLIPSIEMISDLWFGRFMRGKLPPKLDESFLSPGSSRTYPKLCFKICWNCLQDTKSPCDANCCLNSRDLRTLKTCKELFMHVLFSWNS